MSILLMILSIMCLEFEYSKMSKLYNCALHQNIHFRYVSIEL